MRAILFSFVLALYGFSALELHEWVHVPQTVLHVLEHHSDLGHHDKDVNGHEEHESDHNPFDDGCDEFLCACASPAFLPEMPVEFILLENSGQVLVCPEQPVLMRAFSGNIWNPPKRA
ncbi:MAG: hypothetical protein ACOH13_09565 [Flavobacteriales bacterium]